MDWTIIVSVVGQLATWLTIILVYFTLREMRNQRKASQKPDLIIPKFSFVGYVFGFSNETMTSLTIPRYWVDSPEEFWQPTHQKVIDDKPFVNAGITLYNVGFGVAKNIQLKWMGEYDSALNQIRNYCFEHAISLFLKYDDLQVTVNEQNVGPYESYSLTPQQDEHDFLMPVSITSKGLVSDFPSTFKELVSILIYLQNDEWCKRLNRGNHEQVEIHFPVLKLELYYDDLENSHYSKKFDVQFTLNGYTSFANDKEHFGKGVFQGKFEFKDMPES